MCVGVLSETNQNISASFPFKVDFWQLVEADNCSTHDKDRLAEVQTHTKTNGDMYHCEDFLCSTDCVVGEPPIIVV